MVITANRSRRAIRTMNRSEWRRGGFADSLGRFASATVSKFVAMRSCIGPDYSIDCSHATADGRDARPPSMRTGLACLAIQSYDSRASLGGEYEARSLACRPDDAFPAGLFGSRLRATRQDR